MTTADYNSSSETTAEGNEASTRRASFGVNISDVLTIGLRFWYWILISVIVCVAIAWLKVARTTPIFTRSMAVILRDDAQSNVGAASVDLSAIGVGQTNTILADEMAAFKSPDLMEQVVRKLNLQVSYSEPGTFHNKVLYGSNLPIRVEFPDMAQDETARLTVTILPDGSLEIKDMVVNRRPYVIPENKTVNFGTSIGTTSGRVIINATPFYKPGREITVNVTRSTLAQATARYESEIFLEQEGKKSNVVTISCIDASIQRADEILTDLIKAYNQDWIRSKAEVVAVTSSFINDRLNILESELGNVDSDISSFKSTNLIPDLGMASSMYMQQSSSAANEISTLNNQLQMARYVRNYISTEGKTNLLPVNTGIGSPNIEGTINQINALIMQRNALLPNSSESNPLIVDIDSRLAALRNSLLSSLDNHIVSLTTTISNLERNQQTANARVAANPKQAKYLLTAERQQKVKESLYLYLLQKREENELSQAFNSVNTRVLRRPSGSPFPTEPKKSQAYLVGLIAGLLIPFAIIYLTELLNTRIRGRKDLEGIGVPIIGEIPLSGHNGSKLSHKFRSPTRERDEFPVSRDIVVSSGNRNLVNEAFRVLRTNIRYLTSELPQSVMMVTSFNPGSGKTFVTLNTGLALSLKGKRVLLIDCDLRRASLSRAVNSPRHGLADYLSGASRDINALIIKDSLQENLSILPVGQIPPNPTELLESSRFTQVMEFLRTEYDYIFLDCPPVEMMADAQIINEVSDRALFVVRVALFERSMLPELEHLYHTKKYHNMALIINGADTASRYGASYRYGYGYSRKGHYKKYETYYSNK